MGCGSSSGVPQPETKEDLIDRALPSYCLKSGYDLTPTELELLTASWRAVVEGEAKGYIEYKETVKSSHAFRAEDPAHHEALVVESSIVLFVEIFYSRLFYTSPRTRALFKTNLRTQGRALAQMIGTAVRVVAPGKEPEVSLKALRELAARHNAYGVRPYHYSSVGEVLLFTLEKMLGAGFTAEVKQAWLKLYSLLMATMIPVSVEHATQFPEVAQEGAPPLVSAKSFNWKASPAVFDSAAAAAGSSPSGTARSLPAGDSTASAAAAVATSTATAVDSGAAAAAQLASVSAPGDSTSIIVSPPAASLLRRVDIQIADEPLPLSAQPLAQAQAQAQAEAAGVPGEVKG